jgi:hypothetical protein
MCQAEMSNVYYVDTDSLIVNKEGMENLTDQLHPDELGRLKIEGIAQHLVIHNLKDYEFGKERKIKGVGSKAKMIKPNVYETTQWEHFNGAFRRERVETVVTKTVNKTMKRFYNKGTVDGNGKVHPYEFCLEAEVE